MIENQATESGSNDKTAFGAKFPFVDEKAKADIVKLDPSDRLCNHVYHIYHIGTLGAIHQIHHFAPAFDHSTESKLGSIKSPLDELALKDGIRPAGERLQMQMPFDNVREAPFKRLNLDPTRTEPTAPKGVHQVWVGGQGNWEWSNSQIITGNFLESRQTNIAFF
jgi:hypothetical protein